jgi:polyhydroxyalkanoate synthesis repressor PhaR
LCRRADARNAAPGHGFLAARDDDPGVAVGDLLHADGDGAQARAAELVEAPGGRSCGMPAFIAAWRAGFWPCAGGEDLAHDDLVDLAALDACALQRRLDRRRGRAHARDVLAKAPLKDPTGVRAALYNTGTSSYVTLEDLAEMIRRDEEFTVQDAKTGDDITHPVLTQIIFELENKEGQNMLPVSFLRQLISFYGDQMQMVVPSYLEQSMIAFAREQERFREQMQKTVARRRWT